MPVLKFQSFVIITLLFIVEILLFYFFMYEELLNLKVSLLNLQEKTNELTKIVEINNKISKEEMESVTNNISNTSQELYSNIIKGFAIIIFLGGSIYFCSNLFNYFNSNDISSYIDPQLKAINTSIEKQSTNFLENNQNLTSEVSNLLGNTAKTSLEINKKMIDDASINIISTLNSQITNSLTTSIQKMDNIHNSTQLLFCNNIKAMTELINPIFKSINVETINNKNLGIDNNINLNTNIGDNLINNNIDLQNFK